jgi:hypothetical protein
MRPSRRYSSAARARRNRRAAREGLHAEVQTDLVKPPVPEIEKQSLA